MITIGIIGAMEEEILFIKNNIEIISVKTIVGVEFFTGTSNGKSIVLVRSGIGKVNAALCSQVLIDLYGADLIINTGVAGAVSKSLNIGDVVISQDVCQHDFDVSGFGYKPGEIPHMESFFKADPQLIEAAKTCSEQLATQNSVVVGRIATGDQFITAKEDRQRIRETFKALCAEMEGAAIAQAATLNQVPFVIIRTISDGADDKATDNFSKFIEKTAEQSARIIMEMLNVL